MIRPPLAVSIMVVLRLDGTSPMDTNVCIVSPASQRRCLDVAANLARALDPSRVDCLLLVLDEPHRTTQWEFKMSGAAGVGVFVTTHDRSGSITVRLPVIPAELAAAVADLGCSKPGGCDERDALQEINRGARAWVAAATNEEEGA